MNAVMVPSMSKSSTESGIVDEFTSISIKMRDEKFTGDGARFADMLLFKLIAEAAPSPALVSPETGIIEMMTTALELLRDRGGRTEKSAIVVDSPTYNDLVIETGGGNESEKYWSVDREKGSRFMGLPILEAPTGGNGDIYIVNPADVTAFVKDGELASDSTIRIGLGASPDMVVVSADPNGHEVSLHFDEDTNDWCIDCWTCGYSHWAADEEEAKQRLDNHADSEARMFYRK
jgi:hypothetical protein